MGKKYKEPTSYEKDGLYRIVAASVDAAWTEIEYDESLSLDEKLKKVSIKKILSGTEAINLKQEFNSWRADFRTYIGKLKEEIASMPPGHSRTAREELLKENALILSRAEKVICRSKPGNPTSKDKEVIVLFQPRREIRGTEIDDNILDLAIATYSSQSEQIKTQIEFFLLDRGFSSPEEYLASKQTL